MKSPYTRTELKIMKALTVAWNSWNKLKTTHPNHDNDFVEGIHKCQLIIMHRILQRDYPKNFPTYIKENLKKG